MLQVQAIPAFNDNYIWMLGQPDSGSVAVVDPGDASPVLARLRDDQRDLAAILITHHHGDHTGGIAGLLAAFPDITVFGPAKERIPAMTHPLGEGDTILLPGTSLRFQILDVPGHTAGHIAYLGEGALFCGDTLFAAGCGRVFDGTFQQLASSLGRIAALPGETLVYCAHEYTLDNIGFAKWVEPDNPALLQREAEVRATRQAGGYSVPSSLALELATNPFLRWDEPTVIAAAERFSGRSLSDQSEIFSAIRRWKDTAYD